MIENLSASQASGIGSQVTLDGREYTLSPLTVADLGELQAWINARLPDPVEVARQLADGQPAEVASALLRVAYEDVRKGARRLGSPEAVEVLKTLEGYTELLYLHGRKAHPLLTREDWRQLLTTMVTANADALQVLQETSGGALSDPKAPGSFTTVNPSISATSTSGLLRSSTGPRKRSTQ